MDVLSEEWKKKNNLDYDETMVKSDNICWLNDLQPDSEPIFIEDSDDDICNWRENRLGGDMKQLLDPIIEEEHSLWNHNNLDDWEKKYSFLSEYGSGKLDRTSSENEILHRWKKYKSGYYKLIKKLHPDKNIKKEFSIQMKMQDQLKSEINKYEQICQKIYDVLCNNKNRYLYDRCGDKRIINWRSKYHSENNVDPVQLALEIQQKNKMILIN